VAVHTIGRDSRIEEKGAERYLNRNLGNKAQRLVEPSFSEKTPWAYDVGYNFDLDHGMRQSVVASKPGSGCVAGSPMVFQCATH